VEGRVLEAIARRKERCLPVPYYSAAAAGLDDGKSTCHTRLWRGIREPALISRMLDSLMVDGCSIFLETGGEPCQEV
jgi:hypothetical protein